MNKFILILLLLFVWMVPEKTTSGNNPEVYWYCYQVGTELGRAVYISSDIFPGALNTHGKREKWFSKRVKEEHKSFMPHYEASCKDFSEVNSAEKYRNKRVQLAYKNLFMILYVVFLPTKN